MKPVYVEFIAGLPERGFQRSKMTRARLQMMRVNSWEIKER